MHFIIAFGLIVLYSCNTNAPAQEPVKTHIQEPQTDTNFDSSINTIHVLVALCDNQYQGIVPVPAKIGNGQDPANNLYWGCAYGIKSYFKNSSNWKMVSSGKVNATVLERAIFKHKTKNYMLVADAYDGRYIKDCTIDFLKSCAGQMKSTVTSDNKNIGIGGNAKLLAYIGHDGLMDFSLDETYPNKDGKTRDAILLACYSKNFFAKHLNPTKANPIVWSTGLMSPEAYTLHDALEAYINNQPQAVAREKAAAAYSRFQKCSIKAARNLLVMGY